MTAKKLNHDKFCWVCSIEGTNQDCWKCERTFHVECTKEKLSSHLLWYCPVCVSIKAATNAKKQKGLELLPLIMKRVYDDPMYSILKSPNDEKSAKMVIQRSAVIVKEMDLSIIMENITKYPNFEQFLADIEWMAHNCIILHTRLHVKARTARVLLDHLTNEIEIAKMCTDCYRNTNVHTKDWFTRVCQKPHLIVWTKRCDNNYWPAKVMSTNGEEVMVQFFGNHTKANVSAALSCFLYSDDNPNHTNSTSLLYKSALKETQQYIGNICKMFGSYNLAANGTVFDPTMIDIDVYLAEAIPDFDEFDQISNGYEDEVMNQRENIMSADKNGGLRDKRIEQNGGAAATPQAEKVGKIKILPEDVLQTNAAKRIRLNNNYVNKPIDNNTQANEQSVIQPVQNHIENKNIQNIALSSPLIQKTNKTDGTESNSLDRISANIAAELMKKFALDVETLKDLVNARLEKGLNDERAKYANQMDAMQHELNEAKEQLQQAIAEKSELQHIADRKSQQLEKRDRQLAQAHLDYNDLMMELHNAKHLCDACGKISSKNR